MLLLTNKLVWMITFQEFQLKSPYSHSTYIVGAIYLYLKTEFIGIPSPSRSFCSQTNLPAKIKINLYFHDAWSLLIKSTQMPVLVTPPQKKSSLSHLNCYLNVHDCNSKYQWPFSTEVLGAGSAIVSSNLKLINHKNCNQRLYSGASAWHLYPQHHSMELCCGGWRITASSVYYQLKPKRGTFKSWVIPLNVRLL